MSDDTYALLQIAKANAETANLLLRIAGMQAENEVRKIRGEHPAYNEAAFIAESNLNYVHQILQL